MKEEARYSNRQIEKMLDDQSTDIKEHMDMALKPILEQTKKTNGRVTKLEKAVLVLSVAISALLASNPELLKVVLATI